MKLRFFCAMLALAMGSSCGSAPSVTHDRHTGSTLVSSSSEAAESNLFGGTTAWAQVIPNKGVEGGHIYTVKIMNQAYGASYFTEAWSYGRELAYRPGERSIFSCGGPGGCITLEYGNIILSEQQFRDAAVSGLDFKLIGSKGSVTASVSADRFREVLDLSEPLT